MVFMFLDIVGLLKSQWIVLVEGGSGIKEDDAFLYGKSLAPAMSNETLRSFLDVCTHMVLQENSYAIMTHYTCILHCTYGD